MTRLLLVFAVLGLVANCGDDSEAGSDRLEGWGGNCPCDSGFVCEVGPGPCESFCTQECNSDSDCPEWLPSCKGADSGNGRCFPATCETLGETCNSYGYTCQATCPSNPEFQWCYEGSTPVPTTDVSGGGTDGTDGGTADSDANNGDTGASGDDAGSGDTSEPPPFKPHWVQDKIDLGEDFVLRSVWGTGAAKAVAVGNKSTIIENHGTGWEIVYQNLEMDTLNGVWGSSFDDVWAVGAYGVILHRGPDGWQPYGGCSSDVDCDDGNSCTKGTCNANGQCEIESLGGPGCCGITAYSQGWDSGTMAGWNVKEIANPPTGVTWQAWNHVDHDTGTPRHTSPDYALYFGNTTLLCPGEDVKICPSFVGQDPDGAETSVGATVTSPFLKLPPTGYVTANFQVFIDAESTPAFDVLELRVLKSGVPKTVWEKTSVGGETNGKFVPAEADLSEFANQTVQLQFYFDSVDYQFNDKEGVYIDDFKIASKCQDTQTKLLESKFPTLWDVWGTGPDDVFAVGNEGTILHWDGKSWKQQAGGETKSLYGMSGNDDYLAAVGVEGEAFTSFDGGLSSESVGSGGALRSIAMLGGDEAVAVGDQGQILRHKNGEWSPEPSGAFFDLKDVWSNSKSTIAVGAYGSALHFEGGKWVSKTTGTTLDFYGVWGADENNVYAVGDKGQLFSWNGTAWSKLGELKADVPGGKLRDIHGLGPDGPFYAVGDGGESAVFIDGTWKPGNKINTNLLHGIWGASESEMWAVGNAGTILKWTGDEWSLIEPSPTDADLYDVWGRSQTEVYATGQNGIILRWDGTDWTTIRSNTKASLRAVWGLSPTNVYAVGAGATIMHYDGLHWGQVKVEQQNIGGALQPVVDELFGIWGGNSLNVWAVGRNGTVIHREVDAESSKTVWVKIPRDDKTTLRGIWGLDSDNFWLAGVEGTVLKFVENSFKKEDTGSISTLYDIIGFDNGEMISVGDIGTVLRYVSEEP